jgi:DNA-binding beta-propeller fold protein YncE
MPLPIFLRHLLRVFPVCLLACSSSSPDPITPPAAQPFAPASASAAPIPPTPPIESAAPAPSTAPEKPVVAPSIPTKELVLEQSINLGKWPAGIALTNDFARVAESGARSVAKIDIKTGKVVSRVNVGRLPVEVLVGPDETIYTLEHTDRIVRKITSKGVATEFARLPDVPQHMTIDGEALWVLLWENGGSADSTVVRIDLKTKAQKRSAKLGPNAWQIGVNGDFVWVGHDSMMSVLDRATLQPQPAISLRGDLPPEEGQVRKEFGRVAVGSKGVYGDYNLGVVRFHPSTMKILKRQHLGQMPMYMFPATHVLWVATREGSIFQLDLQTLEVQAEHKAAEKLMVQGFQVRNGLAYITEYPRPDSQDKEEGWLRVYRLDGKTP